MIKLEMKDYNMILTLSSGRTDKYKYLTGEEILPLRRVIEQAKSAYSPLGKAFEKRTKTIEEQRKKQINAKTNQNKRLEHKSIYKEIFDKLVKEKFDVLKEVTYEIHQDDLIYYFKNDTLKKIFMVLIMV